MQRKFFGTDGVRGKVNSSVMNAEVAMKLGMVAGGLYSNRGGHRHRVIIGKDTRLSGYLFEPALTAGFVSVGMDVILVGPMPTPAISMLTKSMRADFGVMISASHNAHYDNGIKFFDHLGKKLSDKIEHEIEQNMLSEKYHNFLAQPQNLGRAKRLDDAPGRYIQHVKSVFPKELTLEKFKIVVDSANGAAYHLASVVFKELGAEVIALANQPNGFNINESCGATSPQMLCETVLQHKADIGLALDGDADRLVIVSEKGEIINGDMLIGVLAKHFKNKGEIKGNEIVATIASNLGLENHLQNSGLSLKRTQVGDRYVAEEMLACGANFGGESSGHIIFSDHCTTGDGLIAGLKFLEIMIDKNQQVSEIFSDFQLYEQITKNIDANLVNLENEEIQQFLQNIDSSLENGRVLVRKSGTEPLVRIMVEAQKNSDAQQAMKKILNFIDLD